MAKHKISVTVNGSVHEAEVDSRLLLVHLIRDVLRLTGTHIGCDTTHCGACTLILDGEPVKSCTVLAVQASGKEIKTVEGLAENGELHPIQQGFWEEHGLQCGYCTPGMILSAVGLLNKNSSPSRNEILRAMEGNICRCGAYPRILTAIEKAGRKRKEGGQ